MDQIHLRYSKSAKKVILTYLRDHDSHASADDLLQKVNLQYDRFLTDLPELGGKKNPQAQSVYDCIALFSLYEILPEKPTPALFEDLVNMIFVSSYERVCFVNMNRKLVQKTAAKIFSHLAKKGKAHETEWPGNYHMEAEPYDPVKGVHFQFTSCPIADFAKKHGYLHLMPAMCNPDYPAMASIHAGLIRTKTCALDDCCDYWIVGNQSQDLKDHPVYRDSHGFLRNK